MTAGLWSRPISVYLFLRLKLQSLLLSLRRLQTFLQWWSSSSSVELAWRLTFLCSTLWLFTVWSNTRQQSQFSSSSGIQAISLTCTGISAATLCSSFSSGTPKQPKNWPNSHRAFPCSLSLTSPNWWLFFCFRWWVSSGWFLFWAMSSINRLATTFNSPKGSLKRRETSLLKTVSRAVCFFYSLTSFTYLLSWPSQFRSPGESSSSLTFLLRSLWLLLWLIAQFSLSSLSPDLIFFR